MTFVVVSGGTSGARGKVGEGRLSRSGIHTFDLPGYGPMKDSVNFFLLLLFPPFDPTLLFISHSVGGSVIPRFFRPIS